MIVEIIQLSFQMCAFHLKFSPINSEEVSGKIVDTFKIGIKIRMTVTYKQ